MNIIYRLVWNRGLGLVQVASERASAPRGGQSHTRNDDVRLAMRPLSGPMSRIWMATLALLAGGACMLPSAAQAASFTVTSGNATGPGTLDAALTQANQAGGTSTITVDPAVSEIAAGGILQMNAGILLQVTNNLKIGSPLVATQPLQVQVAGSFGSLWLAAPGSVLSHGVEILAGGLNVDGIQGGVVISGAAGGRGTNGTGVGVSGGGGVAGGYGALVHNGTSLTVGQAQNSITGGEGGAGGDGGAGNASQGQAQAGAGGAGGQGGTAVIVQGGKLSNSAGTIAAGSGGVGGTGGSYAPGEIGLAGQGGAGGAGGIGLDAQQGSVSNSGDVLGGMGGNGGGSGSSSSGQPAAIAGGGGSGGVGMKISGGDVLNSGHVQGGQGGSGSIGGQGGAGVLIDGNGSLENNGTVTGGNGGVGAGSQGGVGIIANGNAYVSNAGLIAGGRADAGNGAQADAVDLYGSGNTVSIFSRTGSFVGNVVNYGSDATLELNGYFNANGTPDTFDVSAIVSNASAYNGTTQYVGFQHFTQSGNSKWMLTGSTSVVMPWTIEMGELILTDDANLGATASSVTMNNSTYLVLGTDGMTLTHDLYINGDSTLYVNHATDTGNVTGNGSMLNLSGFLTFAGTSSGVNWLVTDGALDVTHEVVGSGSAMATGGTAVTINAGASLVVEKQGRVAGGDSSFASGEGGAGVVGSGNATVVNHGLIQGGAGARQGHAVDFSGGGNTLEIQAGSAMDGLVVSTSGTGAQATNGGDTLVLGGDTGNGVFDVSQVGAVGSGAQYQGFNSLSKSGAGMWTLTGTSTSSMPWTIAQGVLAVADDSSLGAVSAGLIIDGGSLLATTDMVSDRNVTLGSHGGTIDTGSSEVIWNGKLSGTGGLTKLSAGTLVLNNQDDYAGPTTVDGGTLEIGDEAHAAASVAGDVQVNVGSVLRGHGSVLGNVTNDGVVWPGGSIGTLTIQGNYAQHADGSLRIDVTPAGASQLLVQGQASLAGSLALVYAPGTYAAGTLSLLQADAVSGRFDTVQVSGMPPAQLDQQILYTATGVDLALFDKVRPDHGEMFANTLRAANVAGQRALGSVLDAAQNCGDVSPVGTSQPSCRGDVWVQATGSSLSLDGSEGMNASAFGLLGGVARKWDSVSIGIEAGTDRINGSDAYGGHGSVQRAHAGFYASVDTGPLVWSAVADGAHDDYRFTRATGVGFGISNPSGNNWSAGLQAAWPLRTATWQLAPRAGLLYQHQSLGGFNERVLSTDPLASAFALDASSNAHTSLQPYLAFAATHGFQVGGVDYAITFDLGYRHDLRSPAPTFDVSTQDSTQFALRGVASGRNQGSAGVRLMGKSGASWDAFLDYHGLFAGSLHDNALSFGFTRHF